MSRSSSCTSARWPPTADPSTRKFRGKPDCTQAAVEPTWGRSAEDCLQAEVDTTCALTAVALTEAIQDAVAGRPGTPWSGRASKARRPGLGSWESSPLPLGIRRPEKALVLVGLIRLRAPLERTPCLQLLSRSPCTPQPVKTADRPSAQTSSDSVPPTATGLRWMSSGQRTPRPSSEALSRRAPTRPRMPALHASWRTGSPTKTSTWISASPSNGSHDEAPDHEVRGFSVSGGVLPQRCRPGAVRRLHGRLPPGCSRRSQARTQKSPGKSMIFRGFPLCAEGDLNPHPLSRTSTSS
jgi:hypothetical protein